MLLWLETLVGNTDLVLPYHLSIFVKFVPLMSLFPDGYGSLDATKLKYCSIILCEDLENNLSSVRL